jgi:hypothetical protein
MSSYIYTFPPEFPDWGSDGLLEHNLNYNMNEPYNADIHRVGSDLFSKQNDSCFLNSFSFKDPISPTPKIVIENIVEDQHNI